MGELKEIARTAGIAKIAGIERKDYPPRSVPFSIFKFGHLAFWRSWSLLAAAYFFPGALRLKSRRFATVRMAEFMHLAGSDHVESHEVG